MPPYQRDSATSKQAALEIAPRAGTLRANVLAYLELADQGGTNDEIARALALKLQSVCPRVNELVKGGFLKDSGETRLSDSGRKAVVWVLT
jgi:predicted transcriptional regulator